MARSVGVISWKDYPACSTQLEEAALELGRLGAASPASPPLVLVSTVDPANIYGAGAPLDIELLEGGIARLPRAPGNSLVLKVRPAGPDHRIDRQAVDRTLLGIQHRHRFCTQLSSELNRL